MCSSHVLIFLLDVQDHGESVRGASEGDGLRLVIGPQDCVEDETVSIVWGSLRQEKPTDMKLHRQARNGCFVCQVFGRSCLVWLPTSWAQLGQALCVSV